jgi:hypothetical protein
MMMVGNGDYYLLGGVLVIIGNVVMIDWAQSRVQCSTQINHLSERFWASQS